LFGFLGLFEMFVAENASKSKSLKNNLSILVCCKSARMLFSMWINLIKCEYTS
jgi:hypothetical protein